MKYDVIVIGSGPGGYVAAIRCAQLGFKIAIVEKYNTLGGTCLNVGCIPSKALLDSSEHFINAKENFKAHGIQCSKLTVQLEQMMKRKTGVVQQNVEGITYLMKKNNIDIYVGKGSFVDKNTVHVKIKGGRTSNLNAQHIIIATGSKPTPLPFAPFSKRIISSTEALVLKKIPHHLVIVGGGVIGMELGSVYARLGAKVTVVEFLDHLIPTMDGTLGREMLKVSKKMGMQFYLGHTVTSIQETNEGIILEATDKLDKKIKITGSHVLVSVGRQPYTEGLGLENIGIELDRGSIPIDDNLKTNVNNVYAIGDVVRGPMLAHKAEEEGVMVAEHLAGQKPHINYLLIPNVVYTWPEVASVGYTEEQLKQKGRAYKIGSFPYKALGRARASMDISGQVKILADKKTDEILGIHIIGARAADMIAAGVVAMEYRASAEDIARISHAHPTYMEAVKEACLAATAKRPIHI